MLLTRQLSHRPRYCLGPLAIALFGLTFVGSSESARAAWVPVGTPGLIDEAKAHGHQKSENGNRTNLPGHITDYDRPNAVTYEWQWDRVGTGPDAVFTQEMELTLSGMSVSASAGMYVSANRSVKIGLFDEQDNAMAGNPTPFSDYVAVNGPDADTSPAAPANGSSYPLTTTLSPTQTLGGNKLLVTVKSEAGSYNLMGPEGPGLVGTSNAGLQQATPGLQTLTPVP